MIDWSAISDKDFDLMDAITERALKVAKVVGYANLNVNYYEVFQSLACVHQEVCELDLKGLLEAKPYSFRHDVFGIMRHLRVEHDKPRLLTDCFMPRFAVYRGVAQWEF